MAGSDGQIGFSNFKPLRVTRVHAWHEPTIDPTNKVQAIAFHPAGHRLAAVGSDQHLVIGDVDTGQPVGYAPVGVRLAFTNPTISWAPDGQRIALAANLSGDALRVWKSDG